MKKLKKFLPFIVLGVLISVLFLTPLRNFLTPSYITSFIESIRQSPFAPVIFGVFYAVAVVLVVPGLPLTLLAAPLFGFWQGLVIVVIASNIGCGLTFLISRFAGKDFVMRFIKSGSFLDKIDKQMEKNGFLYVLYMRAIPLFPFNVVNYVPGLTSIPYFKYAIASLIGMLPGTTIYVYMSYTATDIQDNPWGLVISIAVLVVFTLVTTLVSKHRQKQSGEDEDKAGRTN